MKLDVDKSCIDKELGFEVPRFVYDEAMWHARLKQSRLMEMGYGHAAKPHWLIKVTAEYVRQIFEK